MEAFVRRCPFGRSSGTNVGIGAKGILFDGTEEQNEYLRSSPPGEMITSFALTEPDIGSDAAHLPGAVRDGDAFVINGTKRFITNATRASMFTLLARTNPDNDDCRRHISVHRSRGRYQDLRGAVDPEAGQRRTRLYDGGRRTCAYLRPR